LISLVEVLEAAISNDASRRPCSKRETLLGIQSVDPMAVRAFAELVQDAFDGLIIHAPFLQKNVTLWSCLARTRSRSAHHGRSAGDGGGYGADEEGGHGVAATRYPASRSAAMRAAI
jgi:hypothetical protein